VPLKRDRSFLDAALRETHEEVGISPEQIQFLGELAPPENSLGGMRVWPFVVSLNYHLPHAFSQKKMQGYIHAAEPVLSNQPCSPLPSISLSSLQICQREVASIFHLPLAALACPPRLHSKMFRGERPYWTIDVSDIAWDGHAVIADIEETKYRQVSESSTERHDRLEVWGLTGWYLSQLMKVMNIRPAGTYVRI
jgi:nudix motif 8